MPRKKRRSLKEILAAKKQKSFIGREEQLAIFRSCFNENTPDDDLYNIFNIYGQGGVGKSTLSRQYERIAQENKALVSFFDFESDLKNIPALMAEIVRQLQTQGVKFSDFDKKYKSYRQEKEQLEKDPEAPKGIFSMIGSTLTKIGIAKTEKFIGAELSEFLPKEAMASLGGDAASFIRKKITNKDELELILEPTKVLTPIFIKELSECAEEQGICLIFDTYEVAFQELDDWLRNIFDSQYGEIPENVLMVISGRDELSDKWSDYQPILHKIPLERFSEAEAIAFLKKQKITTESVIQTIIEISDRLPMLMVLLTDKAPETPEQVADASESAVERFLKWIPNPQEREIILAAALPRSINQDMIEELLGVLGMDRKGCHHYYQLLNDQAFVQQRGNLKTYHPVVKDQMMRYQYQRSPKTWSEQHYALAAYFEQRATDLGFDTLERQYSNETWLKFTIEAIYHQLHANFEKELPNAIEKMAIHMETTHNISMIFWIQKIYSVNKFNKKLNFNLDEKEDILIFLEEMASRNYIKTTTALNNLLYFIAVTYFEIGEYEKVIINLERAIEFSSDNIKNRIILAYAYTRKKEYNKAILHYKKASANEPQKNNFYHEIGDIYQEKGEFKNALVYYEKAINLNPKNKNAYNGIGYIYRKQGLINKAIIQFEKASNYIALGQIYEEKNELDKAIMQYIKFVQKNPKDGWIHNTIGEIYLLQKKLNKAKVYYEMAVKINSEDANAYTGLGKVYQVKGELKNAIEQYELALRYNSKNPYAHLGLGSIYQMKGELKNAIKHYELAMDSVPTNRNVISRLGRAYLEHFKLDSAFSYLDISWNILNSQLAYDPINIGHVYLLKGEVNTAIDWYKRSIPLWKDIEEFFKGMESDYTDLKMEERGIEKVVYEGILKELRN